MSSVPEAPSSIHGPRSEAGFPFARAAAPSERDATVLSQPRTGDRTSESGSSMRIPPDAIGEPSPDPGIPSTTSMKLFPSQRKADRDDSIAGERLGHFIIRDRIGAGGMGTVFLADDEKLQRQVALKVLSPQQTADPASVQRFLNEARSAARLDHDHIARVFFYGDDQGLHYIAYEYVQGNNLRDLIRARGRLEPAEVIAYAVQLASALCHTSECGVVHRDIKPSNIIITQHGKAKLVDLGLARKESLEESGQLTVAGTTLGTFDYISPEQAKDPRNVDVRSDIYSLGCTLYHALTGEPPFPEGTVLQRLLDHQDKDPPDPALKNRRVSPAVSAVVARMMATDPKRRYPTAESLLHDLILIASAMGLKTLPEKHSPLAAWNESSSLWKSNNLGWTLAATAIVFGALIWQMYPEWTSSADALLEPSVATSRSETRPSKTPDETKNPQELATPSTEDVLTADGQRSPDRTSGVPAESAETLVGPPPAKTDSDAPGELPLPPGPREQSLGNSEPLAQPLSPPKGLFEGSVPSFTSLTKLNSDPVFAPASEVPDVANVSPRVESPKPSGASPMLTKSGAGESQKPVREGGKEPLPAGGPGRVVPSTVSNSESPYVVVGSGKSFSQLDAACAEIRDQGTIELHYDGRLDSPERPLRLLNKHITIQAARGRQPVLWFAPKAGATDPLQSRMVVVTGGALSLVNVALDLDLKQPAAVDRWALFRLERPERLRLENVFVTVRNPSNSAAALVECAAPPTGFSQMSNLSDAAPLPESHVLFERVVLRGETAGVWLRDAVPLRVEMRNAFVALAEWWLTCDLAADAMPQGMRLTLEMDQNTFLLGQGILRSVHTDDPTGRVLPIEILARRNVFSCGPDTPFIEQQFTQEMMEFRKPKFRWSSDRNYFDAVEALWLVRFDSPADEDRWNFEAWHNEWGTGEVSRFNNRPMNWTAAFRDREWSQISPDAVRADIQSEALVSGQLLDPPEAGVDWGLLPSEPPTSLSQP